MLVLGFILNACIDPLDISTEESLRILVVEGHITTQPGPHIVRLSESAKYGDVFEGFVRPKEDARMSIRDNLGNVIDLVEIDKGLYQTPADFMAVVGRSYSLLIITREGNSFSSLPDLVRSVPRLDSISTSYVEFPTNEGSMC